MPDYRHACHLGGTYFFTVNLLQRCGNDLLTWHAELLRDIVVPSTHAHIDLKTLLGQTASRVGWTRFLCPRGTKYRYGRNSKRVAVAFPITKG